MGFAIIPLFVLISSGFISGTTNGTSGFILKCELLSITVTPAFAAIGAYFSLTDPPAENSAILISLPSNEFSFNSSTVYFLPQYSTSDPADFFELNKYNLSIGKFFSLKTFNIILPTSPVAPTTATLTFI